MPDYYNGSMKATLRYCIDLDVEEPATFALEFLYDKISPGGVIIFDDYGTVAGETNQSIPFRENRVELQYDSVLGRQLL